MVQTPEWKGGWAGIMALFMMILLLSLTMFPVRVGAEDTETGNSGSADVYNQDFGSLSMPDNQTLISQGVPPDEQGGSCTTCSGSPSTGSITTPLAGPQSMVIQSAIADTGNPSDWDVAVRFDVAPAQFYPFSPSPGVAGTTYYAKLTGTDNNLKWTPYCYSSCGWDSCYWAQLARQSCMYLSPCTGSILNPDSKGCFCWLGTPSAARVSGWYVERTYLTPTKSEIRIKGQAAGRANPTGKIWVNPANHWKISQLTTCAIQNDQSASPRATYCTSDGMGVQFAGAGDCGGSCACEDSGGLNIDFITEQGVDVKPILTGTEIVNAWDSYFQNQDNTLDTQTMEETYIKTLVGASDRPALDVLTTANFANAEYVSRVQEGLKTYIEDDLRPMQRDPTNPNRYGAWMKSFNPVPIATLLLSLPLPGTTISFIPVTENPEAIWTKVVATDQFGQSYTFPVNQRLPTVVDARNKIVENCPVIPKESCLAFKGNHQFISWEAPSGSDRIDALIIDPSGRKLGTLKIGDQYSLVNEIPGAVILPDIPIDTEKKDVGVAYIPGPEEGKYGIIIIGKEAADYKVQNVHWKGGSIVENTIISDHVETGQIKGDLFIKARMTVLPDTIRLKSKDKWITAIIEVPGYDVRNIDIDSIRLNGVVPAIKSPGIKERIREIPDQDRSLGDAQMAAISDQDGQPRIFVQCDEHHHTMRRLLVKFDKKEVEKVLTKGKNTLFITGKMPAGLFMSSDEVMVK